MGKVGGAVFPMSECSNTEISRPVGFLSGIDQECSCAKHDHGCTEQILISFIERSNMINY